MEFKPVFIQLYKSKCFEETRVTLSSYEYEGEIFYNEVKKTKIGSNWVGNRIGNFYKTPEKMNEIYKQYKIDGFLKWSDCCKTH